jgi:hypothetical protein
MITIRCLTDDTLMRWACDMTRKPGMVPSKMTRAKLYRCLHSPVRTILFQIVLPRIPTFVSVHIVRHAQGVTHFVESNRDDRGGTGTEDRNTPVNHGMIANAEALINMSRKRLCYASHARTVGVWMRLRKAMRGVDADLADAMVPECVFRNGVCPELRECKPGLARVMAAYGGTQK